MPDRKYVACKFRTADTRTFTYHYDGDEPLAEGDVVRVPDRSGDGTKRVFVVSISDEQPTFPTKPIVEKVEPEPAEQGELPATQSLSSALDDDKILF